VSRTLGFVLIAYAFLVTMLGATLPTPLYPLFAQRYSFGELMVTVIFAVYAFGVIAGLLAFGELSDVIGRKPVLLAGLVLSAVSAFLFVIADSLAPIFAGRVVSGLSAGLFTGTATATLVDLVPGDRRRLASFVAVVVNLGGLGLGTLLAGLLAEYFGSPLRLPFIVNLGLLAPAIVGVLLAPESVRRRRFRLRLQRLSVPEEVKAVFVRGATAGLAALPSRASSARSPRRSSLRCSAARATPSRAWSCLSSSAVRSSGSLRFHSYPIAGRSWRVARSWSQEPACWRLRSRSNRWRRCSRARSCSALARGS